MKRDFMGLRVKVKQEIPEETIDPVPLRGQTMQWSFSKGGPVPQFLSFEASKEEKPKTGFEALASTGLVTITTTEALEKQGGTQYTVTTTYPPKPFDAHSIHRPREARGLHLSTQTSPMVSVPMSTSIHQSFIYPLSIATPAPAKITTSPVVGTTELRSTYKASGAPAQLTIFYAGSVCVYNDISPEKAQAIMLLAGNGPPLPSSPAIPAAPVPVSAVRPSVTDKFAVNHSHPTTPCHSSPISVATLSSSHSAGGSVTAVRSMATLKSPPNQGEPSKNVSSAGPVSRPLIPSAVPQFRKASLARFLEKRKERVLSAGPYDLKQSEDCSTRGSASRSLSANSSGSLPLSATN